MYVKKYISVARPILLGSKTFAANFLPNLSLPGGQHNIDTHRPTINTMATPGATILSSGPTKPPRASCICGKKECRLLTICFQSIDNDIRGKFMLLPAVGGTRLVDLKEQKIERSLTHFGQWSPNKDVWQCTVDGRGQEPERMQLRSDETEPVQTKKYIANHHFNPGILQLMVNLGMTSIDCITSELIQELGLLESREYTSADKYKGELSNKVKKSGDSILSMPGGTTDGPYYVLVPSYKKAKDDYKLVSNKWRLNKMIEGCKLKRRGNSTLAPRGEDGDETLLPVVKRARYDVLPAMDEDNISDVQRGACMLSDELHGAYAEINRLKDEMKLREKRWRNGDATLEEFSTTTMGGLNRLNISSNVYHLNNPNVAHNLFGFRDRSADKTFSSWDITKRFIKDMWDVDHREPKLSTLFDRSGRRKALNRFEQVLLTLMWFQNLYDHEFLAALFGIHRNVVSSIIKAWAPHFYEVGCQLARLPLNKEFLEKSYPQSYKDLNFPAPVASVVDGTDVLCQTVRKHRAINVILRSDKVKHSAFRGITWSLPMGLVHEFTDPFFARASEKAIVRLWAGHGRFKDIPIGWLISGDKGFDQTSVFYPYYNQILHPAFLTGGDKAQFSEKQMDWNRKACENRYTSEVVFARFKNFGGLGEIMKRKSFHYVHYLWAWGHGMANMYLPLQTPAECDYFPKSSRTK